MVSPTVLQGFLVAQERAKAYLLNGSMLVAYKIIGGDGVEYAAASLEELRQWCQEGRVGPGTPVWRDDDRRWAPAIAREELKWDLPAAVPAPAACAPPTIGIGLRPAGFWVRALCYAIDFIIVSALLNIVTMPWMTTLHALQEASFQELRSPNPNFSIIGRSLAIMGPIDLAAGFLYFVTFNGLVGGTPGKLMLGLRVLRANGEPLTLKRAFLRHCGEVLTGFSLGLGFVVVAFTPEKRALHDLLADTRVVFWRPVGRLNHSSAE